MKLPATLHGTTTRFKGNGRKLGYPTANIRADTSLKDGVYFGFADLAGYRRQPALIFIGTPTTVGDTERRVEAHLLYIPDADHYDEQLTLEIKHFHRANVTFGTIDELIKAIREDEATGREWFVEHPIEEA